MIKSITKAQVLSGMLAIAVVALFAVGVITAALARAEMRKTEAEAKRATVHVLDAKIKTFRGHTYIQDYSGHIAHDPDCQCLSNSPLKPVNETTQGNR